VPIKTITLYFVLHDDTVFGRYFHGKGVRLWKKWGAELRVKCSAAL
jgi:hypothetical protein